jgi:hypothetical protein
VPDRIAQLPEPFEGGGFDDGFIQAHNISLSSWERAGVRVRSLLMVSAAWVPEEARATVKRYLQVRFERRLNP